MQKTFPYRVQFNTPDPVPISDVIDTLRGTQALVSLATNFIEHVDPHVRFEHVRVRVVSVTQESPLKESFVIALALAFQDDIQGLVVSSVEDIFQTNVPADTEAFLALIVIILLYHTGQEVVSRLFRHMDSGELNRAIDISIRDVALRINVTEALLRERLRTFFDLPRLRHAAKASNDFFRASKNQGNAGVSIGESEIRPETLKQIRIVDPANIPETPTRSVPYDDVPVEFHSHDMDHRTRGWSAVVPAICSKRKRLELAKGLRIEDLFTAKAIRGNIVATFPVEEGTEPLAYELREVTHREE